MGKARSQAETDILDAISSVAAGVRKAAPIGQEAAYEQGAIWYPPLGSASEYSGSARDALIRKGLIERYKNGFRLTDAGRADVIKRKIEARP